MTVVIGTAGHIDHGKTTLLRALTGIDADRLPEERRRGMTIDVGYAHLALPDGSEIDFVDVPGHDRLIGNMLVGAGEIDAALLVVAADDGPRAQTLEHLELLDSLGIDDGVAVVTKADAVTPERAGEVVAATTALLSRTALSGAPVLVVSATTGAGLDELRAALLTVRDRAVQVAMRDGPGYLAIDRVFTVRGRGLVVTGTLRGAFHVGQALTVLPGGGRARIRELQVHGRTVERAPGGRTALNLAVIDAGVLHRGMVLIASSGPVAMDRPAAAAEGPSTQRLEASDRLLVALRPAVDLRGGWRAIPSDRARPRLHLGTDQVGALVGRNRREAVALPDGEETAILRLERPIAVAASDRFVLRRPSPGEAIAGGRVLDPMPPRGIARRRATPERLAALARAPAAGQAAARLDLHGAMGGAAPRLAGDVAAAVAAELEAVTARQEAGLADVRAAGIGVIRRLVSLSAVEAASATNRIIDDLVAAGRLVRDGDRVRDPRNAPAGPSAELQAAMERLERALDLDAPPALTAAARAERCPPEGVRLLESTGRIVRLEGEVAYTADAYRRLEALALDLAGRAPLTPAAFRDATGTSRRYVMAILEDLDRRGVLRRTADGHLPGPRSAAATTGPR